MRTINKRELNHRTADVLGQVTLTGEAVTVTERGVPKWRITPFDEPNDPLARAARAGRLTRAPAPPRPWRQPDQPTDMTAEAVTRLIAEMKDDR